MKVKFKDWTSRCGDGCCYDYGTIVSIEDNSGQEVDNFELLEQDEGYDTVKRILSVVSPDTEVVFNEEDN